ncbi:BCCT family transporter [Vibrio ostreicida]|uniref:BCCT family transporter n=1 Tax=Vibrio ostreicida TaxID=526588 RepID=A0ABT8BWK1_9VIBR|nr:BCCT family transporter [Vibrio ostreicida]MDN3610776.1 BCCT family transporter [Vibrio ostreicida]NPD07230.1 BCCT transporter [Vibrio ostreicida]
MKKTTHLPSRLYMFVAAAIAVWVTLLPQFSVYQIAGLTHWVITQFDDQVIVFSTLVFLICVGLSLSPLGKVRLGNEAPEFGFISWVAMLFTTGMGSGLIFWGVAEPVFHLAYLPPVTQINDEKDTALALTYFHWGVHAWSLYALAGLLMGWLAYVKQKPMRVSATFSARHSTWLGVVDLIAVLAILFGIAGVLANTMALVEQGIKSLTGTRADLTNLRIGLTLVMGALFTLSSTLGLEKGIKRLSHFNIALMLALLSFVLVNVNLTGVVERLFSSVQSYALLLPELSLSALQGGEKWSQDWTVIYLIWWIAWAPFVGPFIARISRGRSVRQFLLCTVMIPTMASIIWFSSFAGAVFESHYLDDVMRAVKQDYTQGLFQFFKYLPFTEILSATALLLLLTFVISSSDSAIYAAGMLTGDERTSSKISWSAIVVTMGVALVVINDVDLNKQVAIAGAIPFTLVMLCQLLVVVSDKIVALFKGSRAAH